MNQTEEKAIATAKAYSAGNIGGLDDAWTRRLIASTVATESYGGNLNADNKFGYYGRYQGGAGWLADAGLVNMDKYQAAFKASGYASEWDWGVAGNKGKSGGPQAFLENSANWNNGLSLNKYLQSAELQDGAFKTNSDSTYKRALKDGSLNQSSDPAEVAGFLKARHIAGYGGATAALQGRSTGADANGTDNLKYFNDIAKNRDGFNQYFVGNHVVQPGTPSQARSNTQAAPMADGMLKQGEKGPEVKALQEQLIKSGITTINGKPFIADSDYGPATKAAVSQYQSTHNLHVDGVAGKDTLAALKQAAPTPQTPSPGSGTAPNSSVSGNDGVVSAGGKFDAKTRAFLDLIAWKEVPNSLSRDTSYKENNGVRGSTGRFTDQDIADGGGFPKTAGSNFNVGRYQFNRGDWSDAKAANSEIKGYSPHDQDLVALNKLKLRNVTGPLANNDLPTAIKNAGKEWASLPGSPYGQVQKGYTVDQAVAYYNQRLEHYQKLERGTGGQTSPSTPAPTPTQDTKATGHWPAPGNFKINEADKPGEGHGEFGTARSNRSGKHSGLDIQGKVGDPIQPFAPGKVVFADVATGYGNTVVIDHGNGQRTLYAHLNSINVKPGQDVTTDTKIATMGRSGNTPSAGDTHLHFEVRTGARAGEPFSGKAVDPVPYLKNAQHLDNVPVSALSDGMLKQGEKGAEVKALQEQLIKSGITTINGKPFIADSDYGPATKAAVTQYQQTHHLHVDGVAGKDTLAALKAGTPAPTTATPTTPPPTGTTASTPTKPDAPAPTSTTPTPTSTSTTTPAPAKAEPAAAGISASLAASEGILMQGSKGADVTKLQEQLSKLGYTDGKGQPIKVDGEFGQGTKEALMAFEKSRGMEQNGIVGPKTFEALNKAEQAPKLSDASHPDNAMYKQADGLLAKLPNGTFKSEQERNNVAGAVTYEARVSGMTQIDAIMPNKSGNGLIATQGNSQTTGERIVVQKDAAVTQSVDKSTQMIAQDAPAQQTQAAKTAEAPVKTTEQPEAQKKPGIMVA